jgi:hypothetical protein
MKRLSVQLLVLPVVFLASMAAHGNKSPFEERARPKRRVVLPPQSII